MRRCPACHGNDVRRSHLRASEIDAHALRSPYRCKRCNARFWVLSRRTRIGAAAVGAFVVAVALVAASAALLPYGGGPEASAAGVSAWEDDAAIVARLRDGIELSQRL